MKLLLSLLAAILTTRQAAAQCDACFYVPEDPSDCKDYGRIGGETVAWPRASQDCLNVYQIRIAQQDVSSICSSANAFVNALRFGALQNSDAALGLGVAEGMFFEQDPANNNIPKLKATITIDGTTYNCEETPMNCWNGMRPYFETTGASEMAQVCQTLENQNRVNLQLEQSTLRIRLCDELRGGNTATECTELEAMVQEMGEMYPDLACSAYGFGTGNATIPGCEAPSEETPETPSGEDIPTEMPGEIPEDGDDDDDDESSSASVNRSFMISALSVGWSITSWWMMM